MATKKTFDVDIPAEPRSGFTVRLVGKEYLANPPKAALAVSLLHQVKAANNDPDELMKVMHAWLEMTFGTDTADAIMARLQDPNDQIDIPHIAQLMRLLMEKVTGNPTT